MNSSTSVFALSPDDILSMAPLLKIQGDMGATSITQDNLTGLMDQLNDLCLKGYPNLENATLTGWVDTLYTALIGIDTVYKQKMPAMYIAYNYYLYTKANYEAWYEWGTGSAWPNFMGANIHYNIPMWHPPKTPSSWNSAITSLSWFQMNSAPPGNIILANSNYHQLLADLLNVFNPTHWTDAAQIAVGSADVWAAQYKDLETLKSQSELTTDDCLFVLSTLVAMGSSSDTNQVNLANSIANTACGSKEYPNSTMANQLAYYALMYMANPLGSFGWTNAQLQSTVQDMIDAITTDNPAAQILNTTLTDQWKILHSASSYPMVDPYNPAIGFDERMTDTLAAINKCWPTIS